jgi:hypothetical protein
MCGILRYVRHVTESLHCRDPCNWTYGIKKEVYVFVYTIFDVS